MVLRLLVRLHEYNQRRIFSRFVYIDNSYLQLAPRAAHTSLLHYCFPITTIQQMKLYNLLFVRDSLNLKYLSIHPKIVI